MLPGFLLRSLIPVGFMPMVGPDHSVQLVVCDSYAAVPRSASPTNLSMDMPMDMSMDPAMDMSAHHHPVGAAHPEGGAPVHQDHGTCPYGASPALGALPSVAIVPIVVQQPAEPAVAAAQVAYFEVSPRAQSPRGPPV
ncbi:MAG: hypothetical protein ACLPTF_04745 [Steroidobacteraceae bacterium]